MQFNTESNFFLLLACFLGTCKAVPAAVVFSIILFLGQSEVSAEPALEWKSKACTDGTVKSCLLAPPDKKGPVKVWARFMLYDINKINDSSEAFEFTGVLSLKWNDPRQAFDPAAEGVKEKTFQGSYQFNELSDGWYPQVALVNESGLFQKKRSRIAHSTGRHFHPD